MALLKEVLSRAQQTIKNDVRGGVEAIKTGVKNAQQDAINNVVNGARNAASGAIQAGVAGVSGAIGNIVHGDFSEAARTLWDAGGNAVNAAASSIEGTLKSFGITSGSVLGGPGIDGMTVASGNGGVTEGDALRGILARPDPVHAYCWYCVLPVVSSVYGQLGLPWYYVEESNIPFRTFETREVYRAGRYKHYPGKYSVDALRLGVYLDSSNTALNYFQSWQGAILQPFARTNAETQGGGFLAPATNKKDVFIYLMDVRRSTIMQVTLSECWPSNIESLSLSSNTSDRLIAQVTLSVGDVFYDTVGMSATIASGIIQSGQGPLVTPNSTNSQGPIITASAVFNSAKKVATRAINSIADAI